MGIYLHLYFHCFNMLYRTNEVHSSMNTVSLITAQRYEKHLHQHHIKNLTLKVNKEVHSAFRNVKN